MRVPDTIDNAPSRTANGMKARAVTADKVLDFFSAISTARQNNLTEKFLAAYHDDQELAIRALLYSRDIIEGAGERGLFRTLLKAIEKINADLAIQLIPKIPTLGRFDDLFAFENVIVRKAALEFYALALSDGNGLAFKWAPREKSTKSAIARELRIVLNMSPKDYRKFLVGGTDVIETQMCAKEWDKINFSHVPSMASARYQKAFGRNATEAYANYLKELQKPVAQRNPKVKINAKAIFPYIIAQNAYLNGNDAVANEQWNALPNYVGDSSVFPIIDTSASMGNFNYISPIVHAVSLGIYVASKNSGPFQDMWMTFSDDPKVFAMKGSLSSKIKTIFNNSNWKMSTNLHAAFEALLDVAKKGNATQDDMPKVLMIFSDMQFNQCVEYDDSALEMIRRKYEKAGYVIPKIVFWNLTMNNYENTPVRFDERGTALVSGFSPSIMKEVLADNIEDYTPYNIMLQKLNSTRYDY